jgi:hypothetical protein
MEVQLEKQAEKILAYHEFSENQLVITEQKLAELQARAQVLKEAHMLAKLCTTKCVEKISVIEELVSEALTIVLQKPYKFFFEKVEQSGVLKGLAPRILGPDGNIENPVSGFGSAACQIISLVFRVIVLSLSTETQPILILDEPFGHVGTELRHALEEFLSRIATDSGLQIISVSLMKVNSGKVYEIDKINGITQVTLKN